MPAIAQTVLGSAAMAINSSTLIGVGPCASAGDASKAAIIVHRILRDSPFVWLACLLSVIKSNGGKPFENRQDDVKRDQREAGSGSDEWARIKRDITVSWRGGGLERA